VAPETNHQRGGKREKEKAPVTKVAVRHVSGSREPQKGAKNGLIRLV